MVTGRFWATWATGAYLLRRGKPYRLTEDHSWATYMAKARGLDAKELTDHPYSNILTRSVGGAPTSRWTSPMSRSSRATGS